MEMIAHAAEADALGEVQEAFLLWLDAHWDGKDSAEGEWVHCPGNHRDMCAARIKESFLEIARCVRAKKARERIEEFHRCAEIA
jgi:hypothetical protein